MRNLNWIVACLVFLGAQVFARQITGKTNVGSFGPPAAVLKLSVELTVPSPDNILNAGERGAIKIAVANVGGGSAEGVVVKLTSSVALQGVSFPSNVEIGSVEKGGLKTSTADVSADKSVKSQRATLSIQAFASSGVKSEPQTISFAVREQPNVPVLSASADFIEPSGNGFLDAGETGTVKVGIANPGKATAKGVVAKLVMPAQLTALTATPSREVGEIAPGATKTVEFKLSASENASSQTVGLTLEVTAANCSPMEPKRVSIAMKERLIAKDVLPPEIELTEPVRLTSRGVKVAAEKFRATTSASSINVKGIARDSSGVALVLVNGEEAQLRLTPEGAEFTASALLAIGQNELEIKVVDRFKNENKLMVMVQRDEPMLQGAYYALVIAVQEYQDPSVNSLQHPLEDGQNLVSTLTNYYSFEPKNVVFLKNPSRTAIIQAFDQLAKKLTVVDNLLIFYAGHGYWDEQLKQGFWLPANASQNSRAEWISNGTIRDYVSGVPTRHTLLISDACFSGGIFKTRDAFTAANAGLRELYRLPSRKAMTSGTMKEVPDKSVFVEYLVKRLRENKETLLPAESLFASFRQAVINNSPNRQVPQYGEIRETGDEGGDFIFVRK